MRWTKTYLSSIEILNSGSSESEVCVCGGGILPSPARVKSSKTRLHSSRMRTARALTVSPSMLCVWGGVSAPGEGCLLWGVSAPWGGLLPRGVSAPRWGGAWSGGGGIPACTEVDPPCEQNHRGCLLPRGVSAPWGVCSWGVSAPGGCLLPGGVCLLLGGTWSGGWYPSMHWGRPPRERNHTRLWKYNLAPTSLRAVKIPDKKGVPVDFMFIYLLPSIFWIS